MDKSKIDILIAKLQTTGDEQAFAEFYLLTKNGLYSYLYGIVKRRELAEDLMQDTYIRFRQNIQHYTLGGNPYAFLIQIGKNLAFNHLRRAKFETAVDYGEWNISSNEQVEDVVDTTVSDAVIKYLSEEEAQIVMLHIVAGFKHREIADIIGKPLGTVLWSYNNSLKKLKEKLKEDLR